MKSIDGLLSYARGHFQKKIGRDGTCRRFVSYVKNLVILDVVAVLVSVWAPAGEAAVYLFGILIMMALFGIYSFLSLRIRRYEERLELNRNI